MDKPEKLSMHLYIKIRQPIILLIIHLVLNGKRNFLPHCSSQPNTPMFHRWGLQETLLCYWPSPQMKHRKLFFMFGMGMKTDGCFTRSSLKGCCINHVIWKEIPTKNSKQEKKEEKNQVTYLQQKNTYTYTQLTCLLSQNFLTSKTLLGLELGGWWEGRRWFHQPENAWAKGSGKTLLYSFSDGI